MKTPGGPSARTMDVLNGATDFLNETNRLRAPLPEWDWSPDIDWWPGDPLYPAPVRKYLPWGSSYLQIPVRRDPWTGESHGGQHIRPMIQAFDSEEDFELDEWLMDCDECEVSGDPYEETKCWNCGKELARLWRPSDFNQWVNLTSIDERWDDVVPFQPVGYTYGDVVEDFNTNGLWREANERFLEGMDLDLTPWQERHLQEYSRADVEATQQMMSGGNVSADGHLRSWIIYPRRNSGRALMERMIAEVFGENQMITPNSSRTYPVPTNVEIQRSRRRPPQVQRSYPTSRNPTQERRRRNA